MSLELLEDLLKNDTVDLTKVHNILVDVEGHAPFYNELKELNTFSVDADKKGIKVLFADADGKALTSTDVNGDEHFVAVVHDTTHVNIVKGLSSDPFDALVQPHVLEFEEGADEGKMLFAGFKAFLDTNYDGLFSGALIKVEVDNDAASTTTTTTVAPTTTTTTVAPTTTTTTVQQ